MQNSKIDNLSLELLMNNSYYLKYLSKTQPSKYERYQKYHADIEKYKSRILQFTAEFMETPGVFKNVSNHPNSGDNMIYDSFYQYMIDCIKHLEQTDLQKKTDADDQKYGDEVSDALSDDELEQIEENARNRRFTRAPPLSSQEDDVNHLLLPSREDACGDAQRIEATLDGDPLTPFYDHILMKSYWGLPVKKRI